MRLYHLGLAAAFAVVIAVPVLAGALVQAYNNPLNYSCSKVTRDPLHAGRRAADAMNDSLHDGKGDSYFALLNLCQGEPGATIAEVVEDVRQQEEDAAFAASGGLKWRPDGTLIK